MFVKACSKYFFPRATSIWRLDNSCTIETFQYFLILMRTLDYFQMAQYNNMRTWQTQTSKHFNSSKKQQEQKIHTTTNMQVTKSI